MVSKQRINDYPGSGGLGGGRRRKPIPQMLEGIEQAKDDGLYLAFRKRQGRKMLLLS